MTLLAAPQARGEQHPPRSRLGRAWEAPLWAHLAALALGLLGIMAVVGTSSSFSADEGAAIVQARSLARGDGWIVEHPVPEADPGNTAYPLELSERGPRGTAPFAKHPLYALLLAGADRVAGVTGMVLLSLLGTVAAAGLAGLLARRIDPGLTRPVVWVVGLGSPLLFDGYLVIAHTLGAACAAAAVLAAARAFERRRPVAALGVLPAVALAGLFRTEAVFLAVGLAVAAVTVALRRDRLVGAVVAAGALAGGAGTHLLEAAWVSRIMGGASVGTGATVPTASAGFAADRWDAFNLTWLRPSYGATSTVNLLLIVMLCGLLFAAFLVRRGRPGAPAMAAVAGGAAVVALLLAPGNVVPGLLIACPLVAATLLLVGREALASPAGRLAAVTAVVFALGVLATQYRTGGSGEWGGRYFALALPVALPVLLLGVRRRGTRPLLAGLVVCSVAMSVMAVGALRTNHRFNTGLVAAIDRAAGPDRPVLVTTVPLVPRMAWPTFDDQRWLLSKRADLRPLVERLGAAGIERFTFVARNGDDLGLLPGGLHEERSDVYRGWRIVVLRTS